jgi:phosphoglucomutase
MITASHNPPEYNGYKVYGPDGCQLLPDETTQIRKMIAEQEDLFQVKTMDLDEATKRSLFQWISPDVRKVYVKSVVDEVGFSLVSDEQRNALSLVYTPLHGAGNVPVREALKAAGYDTVTVVKDQEEPNGDFPTVKSPNPEVPEALDHGIRAARQVQADVVLGTDPDSDRVGIAVHSGSGEYQHLTGNQVGALLMDFILGTRTREGRLPKNGIVFKTIVTSELGRAVADHYGIPLENTLTGFKYIGHGITKYEETGEHTFLLGYEESYGYLVSPIVRDKDAVQTSLAIAEMASFYKQKGQTLLDGLNQLYKQFGYYEELEFSVTLDDESAKAEIKSVMDGFRERAPQIEGLKLAAIEDYLTSTRVTVNDEGRPLQDAETLQLPKSDVLKYLYRDGSWVAIRPSGTEPKIKTYLAAKGTNKADCAAKIKQMQRAVEKHVKTLQS